MLFRSLLTTLGETAPPVPQPTPTGTIAIAGGDGTCTLDAGGTTDPGVALLHVSAVGGPFVAILAGIAAGYGPDDLGPALATIGEGGDPPGWLRIAAYEEVTPGVPRDDPLALQPGRYVAVCLTGEGATPLPIVAEGILAIGGG